MTKSVHRNISLEQPLKFNSKIVFNFPVIFKSGLLEPVLKVRLISKQSSLSISSPWLIIPLKSVSVNLTYFFTPLKNPISSNVDATYSCFEKYLKKLRKIEGTSSSESGHLTYFIKLPERLRELQNIFGLVLNYAKYRCKENVWSAVTDNSKSICFATIFNKLTQLSLEKDCLRLQINNVDAPFFHAIKLAVIDQLSSLFADEFILMKRNFLVTAQGSLQALEISQISKNNDFQVFQRFRNELRSTIDVNLPP